MTPRRISTSPTFQRLIAHLGYRPTARELADVSGLHRSQVAMALGEKRATRDVQDRLAKAVGLSTAELFGEHAWFKLAAAGLLKLRKTA